MSGDVKREFDDDGGDLRMLLLEQSAQVGDDPRRDASACARATLGALAVTDVAVFRHA